MATPGMIPILLLKTRSVPHDGYEEYFSRPTSPFTPVFVPVLEHRPNVHRLGQVRDMLRTGELGARYGGMIFTSQRAVEGFAQVVHELEAEAGSVQSGEEEEEEQEEEQEYGLESTVRGLGVPSMIDRLSSMLSSVFLLPPFSCPLPLSLSLSDPFDFCHTARPSNLNQHRS